MIDFYNFLSFNSYHILASIAMSIVIIANIRVKKMFNKYSKIECKKEISGLESAKSVLRLNGVSGVDIIHIHGRFNDNFNPRFKRISLSDPVYSEHSISAVCIAAHEASHAVQYAQVYKVSNVSHGGFILYIIKIRQFLVPTATVFSRLAIPMVFVGVLLPTQFNFLINVGIIFFCVAILLQVINLPVEFDASRRALASLKSMDSLNEEELNGAKKILKAAAMTYIAALVAGVLNLFRLLILHKSRINKNKR
ncbi:MAG: zinc metallopeptidase [Oscillospiraceae bacterium]|jgi:Zn-dependent membrane protease YugP|nr:zinc metallopeptidase [Oscillospiraceae bacterium]